MRGPRHSLQGRLRNDGELFLLVHASAWTVLFVRAVRCLVQCISWSAPMMLLLQTGSCPEAWIPSRGICVAQAWEVIRKGL